MHTVWFYFKTFINKLLFSGQRNKNNSFLFVFILIIFTIAVKFFLRSSIGDIAAFHLLLLPVILSAWYGGFWPGLSATIIANILNYLLFTSHEVKLLSLDNLILSGIFFLEGFFISLLSEARYQADLEKNKFIGFASHEIKNPLSACKGYIALLDKEAAQTKGSKIRLYASRLENQLDKIQLLVQELLDVTKMESGQIVYHDEIFLLEKLIKEVIEDQKVATRTHKIIPKGSSQKLIKADKTRISQVLINLLTNAIKYSPNAKKVLVTLDERQNSVQVSVQDFGIGLSLESQKKVFEQFYRSEEVNKTDIPGLGLGLYIASIILKHYQGKIWVKSKAGKGSIFYFTLPEFKKR